MVRQDETGGNPSGEVQRTDSDSRDGERGGTPLSRRSFLQTSALATAGAVGGMGLSGHAAASGGIVNTAGRLQVQNAHVCAEDGSQITLGGMSFFWSNWAPEYYTADVVNYLVDNFGVDVVRAAYGVPAESGPSGSVQEIRNVVEAAIDRDIYVIIDWHGEEDLTPYTNQAKDFFGQMVRDYGDNPHVLYEVWNEPTHSSTSTIKGYCQELADHIRYVENQQGYSHNLVICGSKTWSQYPNSYSIDDPNAAYTFHGYFDDPDYGSVHLDQLKTNARKAMDMGNAVFVTEFGAHYDSHANTDEAIRWCQENGISMCAWSVNDKDEPWSIFTSGTSGLTAIGNYYKGKITNWPTPDGGDGGGGGSDPNEVCNGGTLDVNEDVILLDNQWDNPDATQCVWTNDDGSFGWDFDATGTSGICYPQALVGTKPWGKDTGVPDFPIQCGNVDGLVMETEASIDISGGEWDWAEEWWLTSGTDPLSDGESPAYEIMLVLDWGGGHGHGTPVYENLWTDQYGNTIDLWAHYNSGGTSADFYIFRIQGGTPSTKVDLGRINDWMISHEGVDPSLYMTGIELGNEYWGGAVGSNTVREFDVTINGTTYTSGSSLTIHPVDLPGTIEAEQYVTASDTTAGNEGGAYRSGDVDIEATSDPQGGSYNVGWIESGEWLQYEVNVDSETTFDVAARVASNSGGGSLHVNVDGSQQASTSFGATGGWQSWTTVDVGQITIPSGTHTLRVVADAAGWNLNYIDVASTGGDGTDPTVPTNLSPSSVTSSSVDLNWDASSDSGGSGLSHYNVYVDGGKDHEVAAGTTSTTVSGLASDTTFDFVVKAVDGAGNKSDASNVVTETTDPDSSLTGTYWLENVYSGKALDVEAAGTTNGTNVQQWSSNGTGAQQWTVEENSDGTYRLINVNSGKALDVEASSTQNGGNVHQWDYVGGANQKWEITEISDGVYELTNVNSGKLLDVEGPSTSDGANVHQWERLDKDSQRWVLKDV